MFSLFNSPETGLAEIASQDGGLYGSIMTAWNWNLITKRLSKTHALIDNDIDMVTTWILNKKKSICSNEDMTPGSMTQYSFFFNIYQSWTPFQKTKQIRESLFSRFYFVWGFEPHYYKQLQFFLMYRLQNIVNVQANNIIPVFLYLSLSEAGF